MISFDTNIIIYSLNSAMPEHNRAHAFLKELSNDDRVAIAEQILVEVYLLIRNPAVFPKPFSAAEATVVCQSYRKNPQWKLIDCVPIMDEVWTLTSSRSFARRRIIDARLALTLRNAGVTDFATGNVNDFQDFGFIRVWNPILELTTSIDK